MTIYIQEQQFFENSFLQFIVCHRPDSGCTGSTDVYWTGDCDGDGLDDHVCSTTTDSDEDVSVVLSSRGCESWETASKADCPVAFEGSF